MVFIVDWTCPETAAAASEAPSEDIRGHRLEGRILVHIAPVPDFDRLLNLDGALGRLESVRNVTLADYTKEEVTFRVELTDSVSADEFRERLATAAGYGLALIAVEPDAIQLRLISGS